MVYLIEPSRPTKSMAGSNHSNNIGRAGEFLALSKLAYVGISCTLVQHDIDDAYLKTPSGKLLTLQVKTASKLANNENKYKWPTVVVGNRKKSDIYALVAFDMQKVYWARGDNNIIKKWTTRLFPEDFDNEDELLNQVINSFEV